MSVKVWCGFPIESLWTMIFFFFFFLDEAQLSRRRACCCRQPLASGHRSVACPGRPRPPFAPLQGSRKARREREFGKESKRRVRSPSASVLLHIKAKMWPRSPDTSDDSDRFPDLTRLPLWLQPPGPSDWISGL